ncbi:CATRA system-associated protein [Saccharothrix sp. NPDC042600]|uniref:CATRA system-associated protein n=1 Tax=Saccharothrix TaxID=2071 RepID=UPI0033CEDEDE|nr:hypothetical protein GCM10017745_66950 [Saccharothrix mutabilis subsp. capreolus]
MAPGTVVTFYSYKGGVGRSFTLANIAVLLARWGHRVLCVDWDLEAPGLHDYFRPMLAGPPTGGVVDLVDDFLAGQNPTTDHVTRLHGVGALHLLAAGRDDSDYVSRVQRLDWERLYDQKFGTYLERCREQWIADYDYVLIDSRTGISDIGSICTAHLPDRLIVLFTANDQSIGGAVDIARRANRARDRMPYDRSQLTVLPLLSRFDAREEYARADEWRRTSLEATKELYRNWLDREVPAELMARHLTLPYVSYWSFGEQLPVRVETSPTADQVSYSLETVAAVVAHHFDRTDLLRENRDAYVAAARAENRDFALDLRVSSPRSMLGFAGELIDELDRLGVRAKLSLSGERSLLTETEDDARHLCLIVDRTVSRWQTAQAELFLHRTLGQDRRVIPLLTADAEVDSLPGYVRNLRFLQVGAVRNPVDVARDLAVQLKGVEPPEVALLMVLWRAIRAELSPARWELVDEILHDLRNAVADGAGAQARELAADLATATKARSSTADRRLVGPPPSTASLIQLTVSEVQNGVHDPDDPSEGPASDRTRL